MKRRTTLRGNAQTVAVENSTPVTSNEIAEGREVVTTNDDFNLPSVSKFKTLEKALQLLVTKKNEPLSKTLKSRELGLGLALAGVTELQAHRLAKLHKAMVTVEDRILATEAIQTMDPISLLNFYKLVSINAENATKFVYEISKSINWDKLREALMEFEAQEYTRDNKEADNMQAAASQLLKRVIETQNKNS